MGQPSEIEIGNGSYASIKPTDRQNLMPESKNENFKQIMLDRMPNEGSPNEVRLHLRGTSKDGKPFEMTLDNNVFFKDGVDDEGIKLSVQAWGEAAANRFNEIVGSKTASELNVTDSMSIDKAMEIMTPFMALTNGVDSIMKQDANVTGTFADSKTDDDIPLRLIEGNESKGVSNPSSTSKPSM